MMTILERTTHSHQADIDSLNERIYKRLDSANPLMSRIVMSLLRTKGKQLRPLLLIMCAKIFAPVGDRVLAAASAVELLHNASLIHDDVVDNSMTRRSRPTVNAVWDNHIAVLVGDYLTSSAMQEAISTGDIRIIDVLCGLGRDLSLGEIDQIDNARGHSLTREAYFRIVDYKTASLFVASARMGCLAAGAPDHMTSALAEFALLFGRCFQLRDDVFDYYPSTLVGKPTGNDLREGKISLPLLLALESTEGAVHDEIASLLSRDSLTDGEIDRIMAFARDNGGIDGAYAVMADLRRRAEEQLSLLPDSDIRRQLGDLFDFVIERQY
ncbi:MAG: polyprenyl synthetase family protein [Muribaculaceae bacterium]|nr:polyprenyl synthetase family protein [Muribaculaceae bacterium]